MKSVIIIVLTMACFVCCICFHLKDCSSGKNRLLKFSHVKLSTDIIQIPGDESVTAVVDVLRTIDTHHFHMDVNIQKQFGDIWMRVPCWGREGESGNVGSCDYDVCKELDERWVGDYCPMTAQDLHLTGHNCSCPLLPGTYHIDAKTYHLPVLSSILSMLVSGDFKVHAVFTDTSSGEEVGCFEVLISTSAAYTGTLCIFG